MKPIVHARSVSSGKMSDDIEDFEQEKRTTMDETAQQPAPRTDLIMSNFGISSQIAFRISTQLGWRASVLISCYIIFRDHRYIWTERAEGEARKIVTTTSKCFWLGRLANEKWFKGCSRRTGVTPDN
jgi:hypothetical protein